MRVSGSIHITGDVEGEKVFITYNKSATKPSKPTGTGETDGWSATNQDGAVWMSMKLATDITEEEWSEPMKIAGDGAVNFFIDNSSHTVPADENGVVTSYAGSGCNILVFEGATQLQYNTTLANGKFNLGTPVVSPSGKITVGARSGSGTNICTVANHSGMDASTDMVTITYPVTVKKLNGQTVTFNVVQSITKSKKGAKGDQGIPGYQGPIPYPAGAWNSSTTYTRTNLKVPYVIYNGLYYYLRPVASIQGGNDPQTDYAANGSNATWILIENMQWLFVEILLAQWAKLGSAIFTDNKLISQKGKLNGVDSYNYTADGFVPNIEIDFLNGNARITGEIIATSGIVGGFSIGASSLVATSGSNTMALSANLIRFNGQYSGIVFGNNVLPVEANGDAINTPITITVNRPTPDQYVPYGNMGLWIDVTGVKQFDDAGMQYSGNNALYITHGTTVGFRPRVRRVNTSQTLSTLDTVIFCVASSEITLTLPTGCEDGQMFFIKKSTSPNFIVTAVGRDYIMTNSPTKSITVKNKHLIILIYDKVNGLWMFGLASE